ncbi:MAG: hypothetical protein IJW77_11605 [Clostridia bacterium]|nr:hypothetical protein [Clostridia bacterium]
MKTRKFYAIIPVLLVLCCTLFCLYACGEIPLRTYDEIIDEFRTMLTEEPARDSTAEQTAAPIRAALAEVAARCEDPSVMAYSLHDINDDGTEELILTETDGTSLHAIFTMHGETPVLLDVFKFGTVKTDGCIYYAKESETQKTYHVKYLVDGALVGLTYGYNGTDPSEDGDAEYFRVDDGVRTALTREEYLTIQSAHQFMPNHTLDTGLYAVPLFPQENPNPAPMLSAATYDDVLSLCREILEIHLPRTKEYRDSGVDSRTLYTYPDARTFHLYHRLYTQLKRIAGDSADTAAYSLGYDIHDLNGDGTDELILLSDTYSVLAILTMRDSVPVLISTVATAIDENGRFCAVQYAPDHRNGQQYCVWEISDGRLHPVICVQLEYDDFNHKYSDMRYYAIDHGRKTPITEAEFMVLAKQTELVPDAYTSQEYTRAMSGLDFTPLLPTEPAILDTALPFVRTRMSSSARTFTETDSHTWETEFDFFAPTADDENAYLTLNAVVTEENGTYRFDSNSVRGRIEPIQGGFWLIPEEIADSSIVNRPYLYFYNEP